MRKGILLAVMLVFVIVAFFILNSAITQAVPTCNGIVSGGTCTIGNCASPGIGYVSVMTGLEASGRSYYCKDGFLSYPEGGDCNGDGTYCLENYGPRYFDDDAVVGVCVQPYDEDPNILQYGVFCVTPSGGGGGGTSCPAGFMGGKWADCHNPDMAPSNSYVVSSYVCTFGRSCYKCNGGYLYDDEVGDCFPPNSCTDTDYPPSNNPNVKGTVSGRLDFVSYSNTDYCIGTPSVNEYYCLGTQMLQTIQSCSATSRQCVNGECKIACPAAATGTVNAGCRTGELSPAGSSHTISAYCSSGNCWNCNTGLVFDGTYKCLQECPAADVGTRSAGCLYYNPGNGATYNTNFYCPSTSNCYTCAAGYVWDGSSCVAVPPGDSCTDSDGSNIMTAGNIYGYFKGASYEYFDYCTSSTIITERICSGNRASKSTTGCPSNSACFGEGKCVCNPDYYWDGSSCKHVNSCSETDTGSDPNNRGITSGYLSGSYYSDTDYCVNQLFLVEYYCNGIYEEETQYDCRETAQKCVNGQCVYPDSCTDSDGGNFPSFKGTTSGYLSQSPYSYTDYCINSAKLTEYYCSGAISTSTIHTCTSYGMECVNGQCETTCAALSSPCTPSPDNCCNPSLNYCSDTNPDGSPIQDPHCCPDKWYWHPTYGCTEPQECYFQSPSSWCNTDPELPFNPVPWLSYFTDPDCVPEALGYTDYACCGVDLGQYTTTALPIEFY